jgi:hypothetical protein
MWPKIFDARLASWNFLREHVQDLDSQPCLEAINDWWFRSPWRPYYLHWDDQNTWPDPWQLLSDDIYCDLARGLGILYTVNLLDRTDLAPADLILTQDGANLVLVAKEKYILNWSTDTIVNTNLDFKVARQYQQTQKF